MHEVLGKLFLFAIDHSGGHDEPMDAPHFAKSSSSRCSFFLLCLAAALYLSTTSLKAADSDCLMKRLGCKWTFDLLSVESDGTIDKGTVHVTIDQKVERNGHKYLRERTTEESSYPREFTKLTRIDRSGYYTILESYLNNIEIKEIAFPLKVGKAWELPWGHKTIKSGIILGKESVAVNGKTYRNCYHVRIGGDVDMENWWLAPGVGTVKVEDLHEGRLRRSLMLSEFRVGKMEKR